MKKRAALLLVLVLMISVLTPLTKAQAAVSISKKKVVLETGATITLKLKGTTKTPTWKSSDKTIATVSKGKVTAVAEGTVKITATLGDKNYVSVINVVDSSKTIPDEFSEKGVIKKLKATTKSENVYSNYKYFSISIKNGSEYNINADLSIEFVDKNGNFVESKKSYLSNLCAGDSEVITAMVDSKAVDYTITYSSVKERPEITSLGNSIDATAKVSGNSVVIEVKNNGYSNAKEVAVFMLYYKDGKVTDYGKALINPVDHDGSYLMPGESVKVSKSVYKIDSVKIINISGYRYR